MITIGCLNKTRRIGGVILNLTLWLNCSGPLVAQSGRAALAPEALSWQGDPRAPDTLKKISTEIVTTSKAAAEGGQTNSESIGHCEFVLTYTAPAPSRPAECY